MTKKLQGVIVGGEVRFDLLKGKFTRADGKNYAGTWGNNTKAYPPGGEDEKNPKLPWYSY